MNEMLILGGIVAALWLALMYLKVPSSIAFLSLLIGQLLATTDNANAYDFVTSIAKVPQDYLKITLLVLPLLLTMLLLNGRVAKSKLLIEVVPLLLLSALTITLLAPFLPQLDSLIDSATNNQADSYKSLIVTASSVAGLLSAWLSYPKPPHKDKHGKHK